MIRQGCASPVPGEQLVEESPALLVRPGESSTDRSERVAMIRKAIAAGEYHVSATRVADKLMEAMKR